MLYLKFLLHFWSYNDSLKITVWGQLAYGVSFPKFYAKYRVDDFRELQGNWLQGQILQLLTIFIELE